MNMTPRVALAGNPNCGKTTLFNALTGAHHQVGNYPGVTVEKREGVRRRGGAEYRFVDLPGIYSLTAYSEDELVARDFILDERPDLIIDVIDSTNLERNLFLCLQMQELGIPIVGALNMSDEAERKGIRIDIRTLSDILGIPFVAISAQHGQGIERLLDAVDERLRAPSEDAARKRTGYGDEVERKLGELEAAVAKNGADGGAPARWTALKLLEKDRQVTRSTGEREGGAAVLAAAREAALWIEKHFGKDSEIIISEQRYGYIRGAIAESVKIIEHPSFSLTAALDKFFMNRFLALPVFAATLWAVFQITFTLGAYPQEWLETFFAFLTNVINERVPDGVLRALLADGIVAGVGGVLSFVPLIVILFLLLSTLEDLGYMARAAFACDKLLHTFGLHGQSVFPMMLGFGCSVPAFMAARALKSKRDRVITALVTPMMSCGAKLPIHVLIAGAFFPDNAGNMVMLIYVCGIVTALAASNLLRHTVLKGDPTPFVMELPPYRLPTLSGVLWHVWEKTWSYVKKAGTIIMAAAVLVWAFTSFPAYTPSEAETEAFAARYLAENPGADEGEIEEALDVYAAQAALEASAAGRAGKAIEPLFRPLGFNWQLAVAALTGGAAKEVVVSTLGILYSAGTDEDEESAGLRGAIRADPGLTPLTGFCFMLFMLLIPPCFAALATVKAELGWKWLAFEICFLFVTGYVITLAVYQIGSLV